MKVLKLRPGSDEFDAATRGMVRAERINYVMARPDKKRHRDYLQLLARQCRGEHEIDPNDQYRNDEDRLAVIGRALRLYREKHEIQLKAGLVYFHDDFPICACPHGVDQGAHGDKGSLLVTVRVRESEETFERAVNFGVTPAMFRIAQAQMAITGIHHGAVPIDCYLNEVGELEMHEHDISYDKRRAEELVDAMAVFAAKTRESKVA